MTDNPYDLLASADGDARWAFGTGFTDPLAGIDTAVPAGIDPARLAATCLGLGDDALVYSHRLQQWLTRLPELEEETAVANIALDLLGQARMLLARAGGILGRSEDELAFLRDAPQFTNISLVERHDRDFAELVTRLLVFSCWRSATFGVLTGGADPVLAAIAAKGAKELAYHREYAAHWLIRLGDGTQLSHNRAQRAVEAIWPALDELFSDTMATDPSVWADVDADLAQVLDAATLTRPAVSARVVGAGRAGVHGADLDDVLLELQSVARAFPDATW